MSEPTLSLSDKRRLLHLAREALQAATSGERLPPITDTLPPTLTQRGASFITLMRGAELRGCIGGLQARQPLVEDVREHTVQAALHDHRFPPVSADEAPHIDIEISVLTDPCPLTYTSPADLEHLLRPRVDGVILRWGSRRATFLPQVWEKVPDAPTFLSLLCDKMNLAPDTWRRKKMDVQIYHVEKFTEADLVGD